MHLKERPIHNRRNSLVPWYAAGLGRKDPFLPGISCLRGRAGGDISNFTPQISASKKRWVRVRRTDETAFVFPSRGSRALRTVEAGLAERSSLPLPGHSKPLAGAPGTWGAGSPKPELYWGKSHKALVSSIMCYFTTRFLDIIGKRLYTKDGNFNRTDIWSCPLSPCQ